MQNNLSSLDACSEEYSKLIIDSLSPHVLDGLITIYNNAKELATLAGDPKIVFLKFQQLLSEVTKWNEVMISQETESILKEAGIDYFSELLTAVFVCKTKILSFVRQNNQAKKINLQVPTPEEFVHSLYVSLARIFWERPFLFAHTVSKVDYLRNIEIIRGIINETILKVIRDSMPVKEIMKTYMRRENVIPNKKSKTKKNSLKQKNDDDNDYGNNYNDDDDDDDDDDDGDHNNDDHNDDDDDDDHNNDDHNDDDNNNDDDNDNDNDNLDRNNKDSKNLHKAKNSGLHEDPKVDKLVENSVITTENVSNLKPERKNKETTEEKSEVTPSETSKETAPQTIKETPPETIKETPKDQYLKEEIDIDSFDQLSPPSLRENDLDNFNKNIEVRVPDVSNTSNRDSDYSVTNDGDISLDLFGDIEEIPSPYPSDSSNTDPMELFNEGIQNDSNYSNKIGLQNNLFDNGKMNENNIGADIDKTNTNVDEVSPLKINNENNNLKNAEKVTFF